MRIPKHPQPPTCLIWFSFGWDIWVPHLFVGVVGGFVGVVVGIFYCQIYRGCPETKLLICHREFITYGWGSRWGGGGLDWVIHKPCWVLGANIIQNKLEVTKVNIIVLLLLIITMQFFTFSGKITFYQFGCRIFTFQPTDLQDILNYSSLGCQQK